LVLQTNPINFTVANPAKIPNLRVPLVCVLSNHLTVQWTFRKVVCYVAVLVVLLPSVIQSKKSNINPEKESVKIENIIATTEKDLKEKTNQCVMLVAKIV